MLARQCWLVGRVAHGRRSGDRGLAPSPELIALAGAIVVAWKTRNMIWTLLAGMVAVWVLGPLWG